MRKRYTIKCGNGTLELGAKTLVMGILNVTADSFSDGGEFIDPTAAIGHARKMIADGADIIDIGGESTRPGAEPISVEDETLRVVPIIREIRKFSAIPISIDTYKSVVARAALEAGADIINDISAGRFDELMPSLAAEKNVPVVLMHIQGTPRDMQKEPHYENVIKEISAYLSDSLNIFIRAGLPRDKIIIDPGIGFGKTTEQNLLILKHLDAFQKLDRPILVGVSRKSLIGNILNVPPNERIFGTSALVTHNIMMGTHIVRVHEVAEMKQVATVTDTLENA